ncbi:hypothetical protein HYH03_014189 [Edaphochlamys debaryana]|uniref:HYR domain-containing protein n=1 Tax=Edaphochlamys debaryana TaxID=47281 RepID=A0A835XPE7_9CHLO|nr:hypothetical protein HYH03_014189 [Edaphochlamys debaryana]|eukprot:KAG2487215.1 hypothetical protein HYH03_014189 [Edaphochlamys debaryana]
MVLSGRPSRSCPSQLRLAVAGFTGPTPAAQGKAPVTLRVTSGAIYTDTDFILEISNAAPGSPPTTVVISNAQTVAQGTTLTFAVGNPYTVTFTSTDPDAGALITAQLVGVLPSGATLTNVGPAGSPLVSTFTWTPTTPNQLGTVQLLVSDETNKQVTALFGYTVPADTTKPVVTVPAGITEEANTLGGRIVTFESYSPAPSAADNIDGVVAVTCSPASGSKFPVGSTAVTCTATDASGNVGTNSFTVTITACAFGGFRPPVENPAQVNLVSTQQNLPLKWSLAGCWGMNILAPGYPRLVAVNCGTFADPDAPTDVPTDATVTTALKYDTTEGRYMLGYSLKGRTVINTCYQLQLQFTTCPGRTFLALVQAVRNK